MKSRLKSIAAAMLPAMGLAIGATAFEAGAAMREDVARLIGVHVTDGSGNRFGTIQNVMLDDDGRQATLVILKRNGESEVLRVDSHAAVSSRRGNDLILLVNSEPVTPYAGRERGYIARPGYVVGEPRYVVRDPDVISPPAVKWDPRIKMSGDRRLNLLIGVPVMDARGYSIGAVERVATANFGSGDKAYAIVDPNVGTQPLVVPLGDYGAVVYRVDSQNRNDQPLEIIMNRENGMGYIPAPGLR